jgi:hypothetical protein
MIYSDETSFLTWFDVNIAPIHCDALMILGMILLYKSFENSYFWIGILKRSNSLYRFKDT